MQFLKFYIKIFDILGKGGSKIRELQDNSGARIKVRYRILFCGIRWKTDSVNVNCYEMIEISK